MKATIEAVELNPQVQQLLADCQLPTDDLQDAANHLQLFGCQADVRLVGLVGLQMHGADALLRSLAVADSARGQGLGAELLAYAEQQAAAHGVQTIYLLTTTAEAFFTQRGYRLAERSAAPPAIAATRQLRGLCPATAAFMCKHLGV
ncbi:arsenic resistance N-acetyltransferase ArsN2 [Pseudomonas sp.]|uniref:arsenic resistance N-acetyltransferase ArsN2 n=1 Tax=Pseudomonas sp. TaxID=306 RepID=UPI0035685D57